MSFTKITGPGISSYPVIVGIITALNFKSGTTNIHNVGVEAAGINVLGGDTPIGTGATIFKDGSVRFGHTGNNNTGIITANKVDAPTITATTVTATTFSGDGSNLTSLPAGLGTALSSTQTSPLNKLYYTDNVLSIGATITVDPPPSSSGAYTQYTDIVVQDTADLIIGDGDDLIPDVLGLSTETATVYSATGGRIRAGTFTNAGANGAPTATNGWIVTGVSTATTFKGAVDASTGAFSSNVTISGNLGVAGTITYEDVTNIDSVGIVTARTGIKIGPTAGVAGTFFADGSYVTAGVVTATTFYGSGANLTGITGTTINNNANNRIITGSGTANTLEAESGLTFDGSTINFTAASGDARLTLIGTEGNDARISLVADDGDDHIDQWNLRAEAANHFAIDQFASGSFVERLTIGSDAANGDVTVKTGNLVIGTSGKGIDFSVTGDGSGTDSSELLADYEEGTWTVGTDTGSNTSTSGRYTKVGRLVNIRGNISLDNISSSNDVLLNGLPYSVLAGGGLSFEGAIRGYGAADVSSNRFATCCTTDSSNKIGFGVLSAQGQGWEMLKHNDFNNTNNALRFSITYQTA